jgi:hypothetical protein
MIKCFFFYKYQISATPRIRTTTDEGTTVTYYLFIHLCTKATYIFSFTTTFGEQKSRIRYLASYVYGISFCC